MRGYFGVAMYHTKNELNVGGLWRSSTAFGASFVATVGRRYQRKQASDTHNAREHTPLFHYADMDDLRAHLPYGCLIVGVEMSDQAVSLERFVHPQKALYLLGAEDHGLPQNVTDQCHRVVSIPTAVPWSLNVASAGSIVVAHRFMSASTKRLQVVS